MIEVSLDYFFFLFFFSVLYKILQTEMPISDEDKQIYIKTVKKRIQNLEENKKEQNDGFNSQEQMKKFKDDKTFKRLFQHYLKKTEKQDKILKKLDSLKSKRSKKEKFEKNHTNKKKLTKDEQSKQAKEALNKLKEGKKKKLEKFGKKLPVTSDKKKLTKDELHNVEVDTDLKKLFQVNRKKKADSLAKKYLNEEDLKMYRNN